MLNEKLYPVHELSSMEVHNLVKEKLRLKGVSLGQKIEITPNNGIQVLYFCLLHKIYLNLF